jgi:hypothetical protein
MDEKNIETKARSLVSTSVDDLRSSLQFYEGDKPEDVLIVKHGLQICERRGEKTKAKMLASKLRKMKKEEKSQ